MKKVKAVCAIAVLSIAIGMVLRAYAVAHNELMSVRKEFCVADPDVDNWRGFLPLYRLVADNQHAGSIQEVARVEAHIVSNFVLYFFATEDELSPVKACFGGRFQCLRSRVPILAADSRAVQNRGLGRHIGGCRVREMNRR